MNCNSCFISIETMTQHIYITRSTYRDIFSESWVAVTQEVGDMSLIAEALAEAKAAAVPSCVGETQDRQGMAQKMVPNKELQHTSATSPQVQWFLNVFECF